MDVGQRIKARRKALGLSAEQVAAQIGVSPATVYRYESAGIVHMKTDKLGPIAHALQTTPAYLMGWTDDADIPAVAPLPNGYSKDAQLGRDNPHAHHNGDLWELREQLRRQPGMRILFDASKNATEQDLLDAAALIEGFKKRRDGEE